ncbi:MAG: copper resistance protein CopC [Acidimicrobiales bacterium]|nr:copper resistance protein CopC [Acidimicrobiales bacterium]
MPTSPIRLPLLSRLALVVGLCLAVLLVGTGRAEAHAVLVSSDPADGATLAVPPSQVTLVFSERVTAMTFRVLDSEGTQVDRGDASRLAPDQVQVGLVEGLPDGTYLANYEVLSPDGHVVNGSVVFGVGDVELADVSDLEEATPIGWETAGWVARFATYLGALLAAGVGIFAAFFHDWAAPDGARLCRLVRRAAALGALGGLGVVVTQTALTGDGALSAVTDTDVLGPVLRTGLGASTVALLVGLALLNLSVTTNNRTWSQGLAFYGALTTVVSFALWGHSTQEEHRLATIPADAIHVGVAALWFGGLVGLYVVLHYRSRWATERLLATLDLDTDTNTDTESESRVGTTDEPDKEAEEARGAERPAVGSAAATATIVNRYSTAAAISVVLLVLTGGVLSWATIGNLSALFDGTYGYVLVAKLLAVGLALFIAGYNRFRLIPWIEAEQAADTASGERHEHRELRRWGELVASVRWEALAIVAAIAITAVLVVVTPIRNVSEAEPTGSGTIVQERAELSDGATTVDVVITPGAAGTNTMHVTLLAPEGRPADIARSMTAEFMLPAAEVGPITRELTKAGAGHFTLEQFDDLSIPGSWSVRIVARVDDFTQYDATFPASIG